MSNNLEKENQNINKIFDDTMNDKFQTGFTNTLSLLIYENLDLKTIRHYLSRT